MPDLITDSIYDKMGYNNVLNLRGINRDQRNRVDNYLIRKHRMIFGPTNKNMDLIIKDLLLNRIFDKLKSKLHHVNPYKLCNYGIGDIIGTISSNLGGNINITDIGVKDHEDDGSYIFLKKIKVADSLALEFPHLADKVRIAVHHFVNNIRNIPNNPQGNILNQYYIDYRQAQGEAGRRILEQYQHDITLPNPGKEIRSVIFNMFYSGTRYRISLGLNNDANSLNGLFPSPILSLTKIIPSIFNNPKYGTLSIDYFSSPSVLEEELLIKQSEAQSLYRTLLKDYKKQPKQHIQQQEQHEHLSQHDQWQGPHNPDRRAIIVQYYKALIVADKRLTTQDREILFSYLAYKMPNIEAEPADLQRVTFVESSDPIQAVLIQQN